MLQHEKADATSKPKAARSKAVQNASMELPRFEIPSFTSFVLPSAFRALAENGVMQGKETVATLGEAAEETYSVSVKNFDAFGQKIMEVGRNNGHAGFECWRELVAAQSQSELMEAWNAHARRQFDAMITQNRAIWSLAWKIAAEASQPIAAGISQTFARSG
jgi:hypothetical protein